MRWLFFSSSIWSSMRIELRIIGLLRSENSSQQRFLVYPFGRRSKGTRRLRRYWDPPNIVNACAAWPDVFSWSWRLCKSLWVEAWPSENLPYTWNLSTQRATEEWGSGNTGFVRENPEQL
jgi:hypothetical protein